MDIQVSIISIIVKQEVWKTDLTVRSQFLSASKAAFEAEKESVIYLGLDRVPVDMVKAEKALILKSANWAWVVSLCPMCIHGWPKSLLIDDFYIFTQRLGIFGGWLDDISDIEVDLNTNRWSNVFIKVYGLLCKQVNNKTNFSMLLLNCFMDEGITRHLIQTGNKYLDELVLQTKKISVRPQFLLENIGVSVFVFLGNHPIHLVNTDMLISAIGKHKESVNL